MENKGLSYVVDHLLNFRK